MPLTARYSDLLAEFHTRHQAFWEGLSLLRLEECETPAIDGATPHALLAARLAGDLALTAVVEAAAVGLPEADSIGADAGPAMSFGLLMEQAVETAGRLEDLLRGLDGRQWQRKVQGPRQRSSVADWLAELNSAYAAAEAALDVYLGSFERLGKEGLKGWLLAVYNDVMDSVAGRTVDEIMGPAWQGEWNTYRLLEHVWAWNEQVLDIARHWSEDQAIGPLRALPLVGERNRHLGKVYDGRDMVDVADAMVTVYRKTALLIDRMDPAVLRSERDYPWPGRGSLCTLIFEVYRHGYRHAQEIRGHG